MYQRFHDRFGTAGVVIAVIALVAALGGTALAAGALTGKQKKEVEKIAKKFAGKPGAAGANGQNGAPGAAGKDGSAGQNGTDGKSVTGTPITAGGACGAQTGVKYSLNGTDTPVCNGAKGVAGNPWAPENTLPAEATETGAWSVEMAQGNDFDQTLLAPLSFTVQLAAPLSNTSVHFVDLEGKEQPGNVATPVNCLGTPEAPEALPGHLCVYEATETPYGLAFVNIYKAGGPTGEEPGASTTGALVEFEGGSEARSWGTWALTAPKE